TCIHDELQAVARGIRPRSEAPWKRFFPEREAADAGGNHAAAIQRIRCECLVSAGLLSRLRRRNFSSEGRKPHLDDGATEKRCQPKGRGGRSRHDFASGGASESWEHGPLFAAVPSRGAYAGGFRGR